MLDATDIQSDREPFFGLSVIERLVRRLAGEPDEIPTRIDKGVERIGFPSRLAAAAWASDVLPSWMPVERIAGNVEAHILGQDDRQLVARDGNRSTVLAVDDRDRRSPVTLA